MTSAFLIMPFDDELSWLHRAVVEAGRRVGTEVERADDIFAPGVVIDQIRDKIGRADAVIAVCTGRNANVFYELGIADAAGHRAILIAQSAADLPFDVQHYRAHIYGPEDSGDFVISHVEAALRELAESSRGPALGGEKSPVTARPHLSASLYRNNRSYTLEVLNDGDVTLYQVEWTFPEDAHNWHPIDVLPEYPHPSIEPGDSVRVPISISFGGPAAVNLGLLAHSEDGTPYSRSQLLTPY